MRTIRVLAVLVALLVTFASTPTAHADESGGLILRIMRDNWQSTARVGDTVRPVAFGNEEGATWEDFQWFANGEPIVGANENTYQLDADQLGKMLTVAATAIRPNGELPRITSDPFGPIQLGTPKTLFSLGIPYVGSTITVLADALQPVNLAMAYQWTIDGFAIPGATDQWIDVTRAMSGKQLKVMVTLSAPGYETTTMPLSAGPVRDYLTADGPVEIGFTTQEKEVATVHQTGVSWDPVQTTKSYQWLLDGAPISGETQRLLALRSEWNGRSVSVRVTWSAAHLKSASVVSNELVVEGIEVDVYTTPGRHSHNLREWNTTCEPYSQTTRCRTDIIASTVKKQDDGSYRLENGWAFNNLTYLPSSAALWQTNPLARPGEWTATDGRRWKTECFATTLPHVCRSFAWTHYMVPVEQNGPVPYRYFTQQGWVFNNQVHLR